MIASFRKIGGHIRISGILVSLFILGSTLPAKAEHIIGGLFTYTCVGFLNNDPTTNIKVYRMTLRVYRDCQGGGSDFDSTGDPAPTATITVYRDGVLAPFETVALLPPQVRSVDPDPGNPCLEVPGFICVEEGVYEFELELPVADSSYHIVYQRCCRTATLNNLVNPDEVGATFAVEITPQAQQICNDAPDFQNLPPVVFCVDNDFSFDLSARESDGDSLAYALCSPWDGGGINTTPITDPNGLAPDPDLPPPFPLVPFIGPEFSPDQPLGTAARFDLDPVTGLLTGITSRQGQFVIGICVREYRNGQLISEVRREIQINTTLCNEALAAAVESDGRGQNGEFLIQNCGLQDFFLRNLSEEESLITDYRWEIDLDTGLFLSDERDLQLDFPNPGQFSGQLILNPGATATCQDTADLLFNIFPPVSATAVALFDSCQYGPIAFSSTVTAPAGGVQTDWDFGDGAFSNQDSPTHIYAEAGDYAVRFIARDQNACADTIDLNVALFPVPDEVTLADQSGCSPFVLALPAPPDWIGPDYDLSWDFGNGLVTDEWPDGVTYQDPGSYDVSLVLESPSGCRLDTLYPSVVEVSEAPVADFTFQPDPPSFLDPTVRFQDQSAQAVSWVWDFGGAGSSRLSDPVFTFPGTGDYVVSLIVTSAGGCPDTASTLLVITPRNTYFLPNAFTPNGDLLNDVFVGEGILDGVQSFDLSIWNRWGESVFQTEDPQQGWNGKKNNTGNPQPTGLYVYVVRFVDINGDPVRQKGEVLLLR